MLSTRRFDGGVMVVFTVLASAVVGHGGHEIGDGIVEGL